NDPGWSRRCSISGFQVRTDLNDPDSYTDTSCYRLFSPIRSLRDPMACSCCRIVGQQYLRPAVRASVAISISTHFWFFIAGLAFLGLLVLSAALTEQKPSPGEDS